MDKPLMKCGHVAQGSKPVCVICYGIDPGATIVDDNPPSLEAAEPVVPTTGDGPIGKKMNATMAGANTKNLASVSNRLRPN